MADGSRHASEDGPFFPCTTSTSGYFRTGERYRRGHRQGAPSRPAQHLDGGRDGAAARVRGGKDPVFQQDGRLGGGPGAVQV